MEPKAVVLFIRDIKEFFEAAIMYLFLRRISRKGETVVS